MKSNRDAAKYQISFFEQPKKGAKVMAKNLAGMMFLKAANTNSHQPPPPAKLDE